MDLRGGDSGTINDFVPVLRKKLPDVTLVSHGRNRRSPVGTFTQSPGTGVGTEMSINSDIVLGLEPRPLTTRGD